MGRYLIVLTVLASVAVAQDQPPPGGPDMQCLAICSQQSRDCIARCSVAPRPESCRGRCGAAYNSCRAGCVGTHAPTIPQPGPVDEIQELMEQWRQVPQNQRTGFREEIEKLREQLLGGQQHLQPGITEDVLRMLEELPVIPEMPPNP